MYKFLKERYPFSYLIRTFTIIVYIWNIPAMIKKKVFISHANADYRDADGHIIPGNAISEIIKVLDDNHIERWIDESGLISSKGWCQQIEDAINECNIFLFISSKKANASPNTANEIAYALEKSKHIIPVKIDMSDYHKDIRLNLIRIHYLRYYEDRHTALTNLVQTIKEIKTEKVILDTSVRLPKTHKEHRINKKSLSKVVLSIFNSNKTKSSVARFKELINMFGCKSEKGYEVLNRYIERLGNISEERNYNVRTTRIERLISDIKDEKANTERENAIILIMLKMYLYFCLEDITEVILIQKEIEDIRFELSYIEKNASTINDIANATVRGTMFIAGIASAIMGKGGSSMAAASTKGRKITIVKTPQEVNENKIKFEALKTVAKELLFVSS